jgi:hypothetical protein
MVLALWSIYMQNCNTVLIFSAIKDDIIAFEFIHMSFDFIDLDNVPLIRFNVHERDLIMCLDKVTENFRKIKILNNSNDSIYQI